MTITFNKVTIASPSFTLPVSGAAISSVVLATTEKSSFGNVLHIAATPGPGTLTFDAPTLGGGEQVTVNYVIIN